MSTTVPSTTVPPARLTYDLPSALEASEPPEARGLTRDAVRMLVATRSDRSLVPSSFSFLPRFLEAGDTLVVNTSGTIPAAVDVVADDGSELVVHLSTRLDDDRWASPDGSPAGRPSGGRGHFRPDGFTPPVAPRSSSRTRMPTATGCGWRLSTWASARSVGWRSTDVPSGTAM
jgi:S-adenosylmethionine:tRNA ribosyltransferase-isomerase